MNKENQPNSRRCRPGGHQSEKKKKRKKRQVHRFRQKTKKQWNMKVTVIPVVISVLVTISKGLLQGL